MFSWRKSNKVLYYVRICSVFSEWVMHLFSYLEKTELFIELYGNLMMNSHALEYLKNKSTDLIRYKLYPHIIQPFVSGLDHYFVCMITNLTKLLIPQYYK